MTLLSLSRDQRDALERQDAAEARRLAAQYQAMVDRLEGDIDALTKDAVSLSPAEVRRLESYKRLMDDARRELDAYRDYLLAELAIVAGLWLEMGSANSQALLAQAFEEAGIERGVTGLGDDVIAALNRYLAKGSPLYARLQQYGAANADRIKQIILESVTKGLQPRVLARLIVSEGFGMGLTDALRMARTLQLYAYREATLINYQRHSDILNGWIWSSALIPGRTCMSCVNMHGTIHPLTEFLRDHHAGLCAMIPYVGGNNPVREMGLDWFNRQGKEIQVKMMGASKWDAWKAGKFEFSQLTTEYNDPVYGVMLREQSLKALLEGREQ